MALLWTWGCIGPPIQRNLVRVGESSGGLTTRGSAKTANLQSMDHSLSACRAGKDATVPTSEKKGSRNDDGGLVQSSARWALEPTRRNQQLMRSLVAHPEKPYTWTAAGHQLSISSSATARRQFPSVFTVTAFPSLLSE